ncbi:MAG TPA: 2-amino-4-hydroxy-6-hydroxymethyldihydropteridine diphosphokinase [Chitinophagaceae bacterium]|nr:2-amino-4-hydroxy-6-hydroxymethyldihydropteridine diphosphokinase [Chitinophagaceae bacterium]
MHIAYLLTGGNLGDRKENLEKAAFLINKECGEVFCNSSIYETSAWGNSDQPSFYNQAIAVKTSLTARQLMRKILKIEKSMGRIRKEKYGPRIIDIDILFYDDEIHNYHLLKLPHPELPNRRFALVPLCEIAPDLIHPVLKKNVQELLLACRDELDVKMIS